MLGGGGQSQPDSRTHQLGYHLQRVVAGRGEGRPTLGFDRRGRVAQAPGQAVLAWSGLRLDANDCRGRAMSA